MNLTATQHTHSSTPARSLSPWQAIALETSRYRLKTIDSFPDLIRVLELRSRLFSMEYGRVAPPSGLDVDRFDFVADHLAIECKESGEWIGTYRLISTRQSEEFYSGTEFEIDEFIRSPGSKLELGRACIHPDHRNGATLGLLWRGIVHYAKSSGIRYLFGCSSVKIRSRAENDALLELWATQDKVGDEWSISPKSPYRFEEDDSGTSPDLSGIETPPLLRTYFKAGAKVYGSGAYDHEFECVDFFTVLDLSQMEAGYGRRFSLQGNA
jgi:putative hemolysin